MTAGNFIAQKS